MSVFCQECGHREHRCTRKTTITQDVLYVHEGGKTTKGWEIVKEKMLCDTCYPKVQTVKLIPLSKDADPVIRQVRRPVVKVKEGRP